MNYPLVKDITLFLDDKPSVFALRQKAKEALAKSGFPSNKTEAWKYTNIKNLINNSFELNTNSEPCGHDCCNHHTANKSFIEVTFCHGKLRNAAGGPHPSKSAQDQCRWVQPYRKRCRT